MAQYAVAASVLTLGSGGTAAMSRSKVHVAAPRAPTRHDRNVSVVETPQGSAFAAFSRGRTQHCCKPPIQLLRSW